MSGLRGGVSTKFKLAAKRRPRAFRLIRDLEKW
jgi:hypothetical protein